MTRRALLNALAREDFVLFLEKVATNLNPGQVFKPNWHHQAIAHELERVRDGEITRLIVTMPPRSLKSIAISVAFVAWMLGRQPSLKFVCVSYGADLALKHARDCRLIMETDWYKAMFPPARLARTAEADLVTTAGGGRFSTSVGGVITGRGGDYIVIDDPIKPEDANSELLRENLWDWYRGTLLSRLDDKVKGRIIVVQQRVHEDDLVGRLLDVGGFTQLKLAAIAEGHEDIAIGQGLFHHRREGEPLHPEREPLARLEEMKAAMGASVFAAQYQQSPVPPGGNMIKKEWIKRYEGVPERRPRDTVIMSVDTAAKMGSSNDYSVAIIALVRGKQIFILEVSRDRLAFPDLYAGVVFLAQEFDVDVLLIEDANSGTQLLQTLEAERPRGVPLAIPVKPKGDKQNRVSSACFLIEPGGLELPTEARWLADFETELFSYPSVRHDDQVDALAQLVNYVIQDDRLPRLDPACVIGALGPSSWRGMISEVPECERPTDLGPQAPLILYPRRRYY